MVKMILFCSNELSFLIQRGENYYILNFSGNIYLKQKCWYKDITAPLVFSSPELKAQVSFSDHLSSVVCPSVCPDIHPSVRLCVNFSHFHLLLQNHLANFNQTWHKASLGKGDSSLFKWRTPPFSKGR